MNFGPEDSIADYVMFNPEKAGFEFDLELRAAIPELTPGSGNTFHDYFEEPGATAKAARKHALGPSGWQKNGEESGLISVAASENRSNTPIKAPQGWDESQWLAARLWKSNLAAAHYG